MKKPNLPLMQGKPRLLAQQPRNGPTGSTLSLAELAEQYEESNYSTPITLKLNSAYPTLQMRVDRPPGLFGAGRQHDQYGWRQQSPFRNNKQNINDQGVHRKKSINQVNRFADCVKQMQRQHFEPTEEEAIAFKPRSGLSPLRGRNVAPVNPMRHNEEELVFRAKAPGATNLNLSQLAKRYTGQGASKSPSQPQTPQNIKHNKSKTKVAPRIQKQFQQSDDYEPQSQVTSLRQSQHEHKPKISSGLRHLVHQNKQNHFVEQPPRVVHQKKPAVRQKSSHEFVEEVKGGVYRELQQAAYELAPMNSGAFPSNTHIAPPKPVQQPLNSIPVITHPQPQQVPFQPQDSNRRRMEEVKNLCIELAEIKQKKTPSNQQQNARYTSHPTQPILVPLTVQLKPAVKSSPSQAFSFEQGSFLSMRAQTALKPISEQKSQVTSEARSSITAEMMEHGLPKMIESVWPKQQVVPPNNRQYWDMQKERERAEAQRLRLQSQREQEQQRQMLRQKAQYQRLQKQRLLRQEQLQKQHRQFEQRQRLDREAQLERQRKLQEERVEQSRIQFQRQEAERLELLRQKQLQELYERQERERMMQLAEEELRRKQQEQQQLRLLQSLDRRQTQKREAERLEQERTLKQVAERAQMERIQRQIESQRQKQRLQLIRLEAERIQTQRLERERLQQLEFEREKERLARQEVEQKLRRQTQLAGRLELQRQLQQQRLRRQKEYAQRLAKEQQQRVKEAEKIRLKLEWEQSERKRIEGQRLEQQQRDRKMRLEQEEARKRELERLQVIRIEKQLMEREALNKQKQLAILKEAQQTAKLTTTTQPSQSEQQLKKSMKYESLFTKYSITPDLTAPELTPEDRVNKLFEAATNQKPLAMQFKFDFGLDLGIGQQNKGSFDGKSSKGVFSSFSKYR